MNPLTRFKIEESEYLEKIGMDYEVVKLRMRALIFLLDYSLFFILIYLTNEFVKLFIPEVPNIILYVLITFYSLVFIAIEYYFDGTIFKVLFNARCMSLNCEKLRLHIYLIKFLLRPIAFVLAVLYLKFCFSIILWLFGIHKPLFKFLDGRMVFIWYDEHINQMVTKVPIENA
ncbi:hypothetical protein [uncultured Aquimarina sp.]|uniref:hypothetical protein n=1 Tax=uncultured Aquimarina sp. TaxID=575652 RepID=UPI002639635C|nr:hypothetical protein [uncultured Aquimarina sp.]